MKNEISAARVYLKEVAEIYTALDERASTTFEEANAGRSFDAGLVRVHFALSVDGEIHERVLNVEHPEDSESPTTEPKIVAEQLLAYIERSQQPPSMRFPSRPLSDFL